MSGDATTVIQSTGATANSVQVHHRDFPEIRSQGEDARSAAKHLANELTKALDSALTKWRRESIEKAIADVRAFAQQEAGS